MPTTAAMADIPDASEAVLQAYGAFTADSEGGRKALARIKISLEEWFNAAPRTATAAASFSIDKFADAEVDHVTPGNRGLGRVGDNMPRLAARHWGVISRMDPGSVARLRQLVRRHVLCGYLFAEYIYGLNREAGPKLTHDQLYEMWVPAIYSSSPLVRLDSRSKDEEGIKTIWFGSTGREIRDHLQAHGAAWGDLDLHIVTHYFDGGMRLRVLEVRSLTDEELKDIATGGAYSREKARSQPPGSPLSDKPAHWVAGRKDQAIKFV